MEYTILNNGVKMPMDGFGVFQVRDQSECEQTVLDAVSVEYRLIDTAASYGNEEAVGAALKKSGACREEMAAIAPLDIGHSEIVDHFDPNFVKALHGRFGR